MESKLLFVSVLCMVAVLQFDGVYGATTTKEPNEKENYHFFYDRNTHKMAMKVQRQCYVIDLTPTEQQLTHTTLGMIQLESKMVSHLKTASMTKTSIEALEALSHQIARGCGHTDAQYMMTI